MTDPNTPADPASPPTSATPPAPSNEPAPTITSAEPAAPASPAPSEPNAPAPVAAAPAPEEGEIQKLRLALAGGDENLLKSLERYKTVDSISKAFKEGRNAAKQVGKPLTLAEKASEEEIKAYRAAVGIPDEAKDYPVKFRDDFKASEHDGVLLDSFKEYLHSKSADPRAAGAALEWYQDFAVAQKQALDGKLSAVAKETQTALRTEWGGEYDGNISAASELMKSHLGEEGFDQMMGQRLMDGSRLQDNAAFVKMMAQIGSDYYGGNAIHTGDIETTSKTVQDRIDEMLQLRTTDSKKYFSDDVQSKLTKLYAQKERIGGKK